MTELGATVIEVRTSAVTCKALESEIDPEAALIVVEPILSPAATPDVLTDATAGLVDDQITDEVRFFVLPSLYVPVAVNCSVIPIGMDA